MFQARRITQAKWETGRKLSAEEISAEAVTESLRTHENALSLSAVKYSFPCTIRRQDLEAQTRFREADGKVF